MAGIAITSRSDARAASIAIQMPCWHKLEHVGYPILVRCRPAPIPKRVYKICVTKVSLKNPTFRMSFPGIS